MIVSTHKQRAAEALKATQSRLADPHANAGALIGIGYALLELAYQVGRVADQTPVYGPPEEQP